MDNLISINGVGTYFPERVITNDFFEYEKNGGDERWLKNSGLKERRWAKKGESIIDLAYKASLEALKDSGLKPDEIDFVIMVSGTFQTDRLTPSGVINLKDKLGIKNGLAIDLLDLCGGLLLAIEVASYAILSSSAKNVLVVATETYSKGWNNKTLINLKVSMCMADGAGALILSNSDKKGLIDRYIKSSSEFEGGLGVKIGDHLNKTGFFIDSTLFFEGGDSIDQLKIFKRIREFTSKAIPESIDILLKRNKISKEEISCFLYHQPNRDFLNCWKEIGGISDDKTIDTFDKYANLSTVSLIANLKEALDKEMIKKGDKFIMAAIGEGVNWGSILWQWNR